MTFGVKGAAALVISLLPGCITGTGPDTSALKEARLDGKVHLGWEDTQRFLYFPSAEEPLAYVIPATMRISDDDAINADPALRVIKPGAMYTDGGSIPRIFWSAQGLSPFDYLPAYVIHDWIYLEHRCHKKLFGTTKNFPYSRELADMILKDSLDRLDAKRTSSPANAETLRRTISKAVADYGGTAWNGTECERAQNIYQARTQERTVVEPAPPLPDGINRTITRRMHVRPLQPNIRILATVDAGG